MFRLVLNAWMYIDNAFDTLIFFLSKNDFVISCRVKKGKIKKILNDEKEHLRATRSLTNHCFLVNKRYRVTHIVLLPGEEVNVISCQKQQRE